MKKLWKIVLFVFTVWPIAYIFLFSFTAFNIMINSEPGPLVQSLMIVHAGTMLISLGLLVFYTLNLYRNNKLSGNSKMTWLIGFFFLSGFAMSVYWAKYIWRS